MLFLSGCTNYKYEPGRDTRGYWGKDAQYQIIHGGNYRLINLETNITIDPYIHKYFQDGDIVYFNGSKGYTILNPQTGEIKQNICIDYFSNEEKEIYKYKEFTMLTPEEYMEFQIEKMTTKNHYSILEMKIYLAYDPNDEITKNYLLTNDQKKVNKVIMEWLDNNYETSKFMNDKTELLNYLNKEIPQIHISRVEAWFTAGGPN